MSEFDCSYAEPYALQVLGPDMEPEFPDQCIIVIEPGGKCGDGAYVVAFVEDTRWFRRYREDQNGRKWLEAENELFPDIELNGLQYQIEGVIIQRNIKRKIKKYSHYPKLQPIPIPVQIGN